MREGLTELVFILDRSGSMHGLEKDTIGGFNGMLEKQKNEEGEVLLSAVLFDDTSEVLYDRVDIKTVEPMTNEQYFTRGCTALLDAIGGAITHIKKERKEMPKAERPERTIFVITTDGLENASKEYSYEKVKEMIEKRQEKNWEFIFLGANIDAVAEAGRMGIQASRAVTYECDAKGTAVNYEAVSNVVAELRCCCPSDMSECLDSGDWAEDIRSYKEKKAGE